MILGYRGMIADREISNLLRRSKIFPQGVELAYTYQLTYVRLFRQKLNYINAEFCMQLCEVPILKFHFVEKVIHKNTYL